ncbi:DEAD/DEAH box helicase family protein [Filomicrobium sp.]|uniref:DEAD/DEAH box helicase family protein n=1 Tax=Filomicrobium sp. TaxID=2024831 RepID=UPI00259093FD|nr:DEAD/DEAH box helicase family protein [Filomicrobium sp.]MCV0368135.1 DEAD/DEAH box helicase family protein [Filomicrobium sp.]
MPGILSGRSLIKGLSGTGETYTTVQIIWRLRKLASAKRTIFLPDRNTLVDQTRAMISSALSAVVTNTRRP